MYRSGRTQHLDLLQPDHQVDLRHSLIEQRAECSDLPVDLGGYLTTVGFTLIGRSKIASRLVGRQVGKSIVEFDTEVERILIGLTARFVQVVFDYRCVTAQSLNRIQDILRL